MCSDIFLILSTANRDYIVIVLLRFIGRLNDWYWELNYHLNVKICKCSPNISSFHPLEVVGRGSETQLQVAVQGLKQPFINETGNYIISVSH